MLEVEFKGRVGGPMINGIEVFRQTGKGAAPQLGDTQRPTARSEDEFVLEWPIAPDENDEFQLAVFRCWVPGGVRRLHGAIVMTPGLNSDGRMWADVPEWRELARTNRCALVGSWFRTHWGWHGFPEESLGYMDASASGAGDALLKALDAFAKKTGRPELTSVPLVLWGHSAGGVFNLHFAQWKPERVVAFVVNKFAFVPDELPRNTFAVPALLVAGELDRLSTGVRDLFRAGRAEGALWCYANEQRSGHGINAGLGLTHAFFAQAIPLRVHGSCKQLAPLDAAAMWLGDLKTFDVHASDSAEVNTDTNTVYLLNAEFAEEWQTFVRDPRNPFASLHAERDAESSSE
jgi:pimeloyl-ACP methyl ester carboxylesterase